MLPVASDAHVDGSNLKQTKSLVGFKPQNVIPPTPDTEVCTPPVRRLQTQQLINGSRLPVSPSVETHGVRGLS